MKIHSLTRPRCFAYLMLTAIVALMAACGKSEQTAAGPKTFASEDDAFKAVYTAAKAGDSGTLLTIFGPDAKDLLFSGDAVQDKAALSKFCASSDQMHRWRKAEDGLVLDVGADNYPFPFPLKENSAGQWHYDVESARDELLARRIGSNELAAIDVLNAMADAQAEYFGQTHDGGNVRKYAQKFISSDGKQDGLYWKAAENQPESPLGPLAAYASSEGYTGKTEPFHGYYYRILTKQGEDAPGGALDYVVNGNMTRGFAILAYPAEYGNSGVMSLLINQSGVVFEKDLGAGTADVAKATTEFNPDDTWKPLE
jgi:hypothetical protein